MQNQWRGFLSLLLAGFLFFSQLNCSAGGGGGIVTQVAVSGVVRDENGLPVSGATVISGESRNPNQPQNHNLRAATNANGQFTINVATYGSFYLQIIKSGCNTVVVNGFTGAGQYDALSITQTPGGGQVDIDLPAPLSLNATGSGRNAILTWDQSQEADFAAYLIMRSNLTGVDVLCNNVGKFTSAATTTMTDKNLTAGTWYYRLFQVINTGSGQLMLGSNQVSLVMDSANAFPARVAFIMMKTLPAQGGGFEHQARYVVTTTDISQIIPAGLTVNILSPLFEGTALAAYGIINYKRIKNYYYGNPAHYLGEVSMPGDWTSKYYVSRDNYPADERMGTHRISINGNILNFGTFTASQPGSKIYLPVLTRKPDNSLELSWSMLQDNLPFSGGAGNYGWKYLVKITCEGIYAGGNDPTYQYEKFWSNLCIKDLGFNQICDRILNMPQDTDNKIIIPDGIFSQGSTIGIALYAISTTETYNNPTSELASFGKSFMYWLYLGGVETTVP